ncbi:MAG: hypothetical protein ACI8ZB_001515 [Desulforhopalus sp.]|jgi:hypothetical protein
MLAIKIRKPIQVIATVFCLVLGYSAPVFATDDLDDLLTGFDDIQETKPITGANAEDEGFDGLLSGFDEPTEPQQNKTDEGNDNILPPWLELFGSISILGTWNYDHEKPDSGETDYRGLSMLKTTGALGADIDMGKWQVRISGHGFYDAAYSIQDRDNYYVDLLDDYEQEVELDELYLQGSLTDNFDVKIGRQVVVWGKADNLRVTDILNPLDNRYMGLVDIKYKRLPVTMSKFDYYTGDWNFSSIIINEVRFDKNPVYNSDFYPGNSPAVSETEPTNFAFDTQQYAMALNGIFSGWDLSFYQAWVYDSRAHLSQTDDTAERVHNRVSMSGLTGNIALGNWLFKAEGAWWNGLEYGAIEDEEFNRLDLMAGVEYMGFSETAISVEFLNQHILDFDTRLEGSPDYAEENIQKTAIMISRDFANDTNQVKLLCTLFGSLGQGGAFERLQFEHDLSDHITLTAGVIIYQSGDLYAFSDIDNNDRIFLEYTYAF